MQKYFDACAALSSSRSRLTLVTAKEEGRQVEKAHKAYDQATLEMEIAKNQFLLDNDLANVAKSRLYGEDLPAVMGDFQTLESSAISHAAHLLSTSLVLAKDIFFKLMSGVTDSLSVVGDVDAGVDQRMFVEASGGRGLRERFELPRDLTWEESSVWHDTVRLQNILAIALGLTACGDYLAGILDFECSDHLPAKPLSSIIGQPHSSHSTDFFHSEGSHRVAKLARGL